jgi:hypothetical protein
MAYPNCRHRANSRCTLELYGGNPTGAECRACDKYQGRPRGAGDVVHAIAKALRLDKLTEGRACGCAERRKRWNHAKKKPENER